VLLRDWHCVALRVQQPQHVLDSRLAPLGLGRVARPSQGVFDEAVGWAGDPYAAAIDDTKKAAISGPGFFVHC
jgi:hypothetical protein